MAWARISDSCPYICRHRLYLLCFLHSVPGQKPQEISPSMNLTAPKSQTDTLLGLKSLFQILAALAPSKRSCNGRSFVWLVLSSLRPMSFMQNLLCPAVRNTHSKSWALRREPGMALPRHLWLERGLWHGTSLPQDSRLRGHTWSREEVGLLRLLFPLAEALPVCLSSLLFVHRNPTRSHRAGLGRAALRQLWAHKSAVGMLCPGSPGVTWAAALAPGCHFHAGRDVCSSWWWWSGGDLVEMCRVHLVRALFVYSKAEFSLQLLVPLVEQDCNALPKYSN